MSNKKETQQEETPQQAEEVLTNNDTQEKETNSTAETEEKQTEKQEEISETDQLKEDLQKEKDKFLRLFAEFENYKRRTGKERLELFKTASQEVMQAMLPVLDDFDRALVEIAKAKDKDLLKGVELISNKLQETLKAKGLEPMAVKPGDTFDADLHEAITQIPAPEKKLKGKIVDVVEKGYLLGDKIIRFPKVVTGK